MTQERGMIAVIGMAGRFPGATGIDALWRRLLEGADLVSDFKPGTLLAAGLPPEVVNHGDFIRSFGVLDDADAFDARFFGYPAREAALIDPQQRVFLECAWEALEHAGRYPRRNPETVGIFAGAAINKYLLFNLLGNPEAYTGEILYGEGLIPTFSSSDYLASRVAFKLGMNGPAISVKAACATGLVATALACQSLADFSCDTAIAGGVSIGGRGPRGYFARRGGMASVTGRCRPFDAAADGSVFGDGAGCVVLKRFEDALKHGDVIHALIRGWATNCDGADRVGFSAPSVQGQAAVIAEAMMMAGVEADQVGYIEAHGSATPTGDPIEFSALAKAFQAMGATSDQACGLGSVKSNVGHLDAAAGVAGLIKAIHCVREGLIPGTLHFKTPNPQVDLQASPFFISPDTSPFPSRGPVRVAGVSAFGLGGINAHLVIQNHVAPKAIGVATGVVAIPIGANTPDALERQLRSYERAMPGAGGAGLADWAVTAARRNDQMPIRAAAVGHDWPSLRRDIGKRRGDDASPSSADARVVFTFSGGGQARSPATAALYETYPAFRRAYDECRTISQALGVSLEAAVSSQSEVSRRQGWRAALGEAVEENTVESHVSLFAAGYATSRCLAILGVTPAGVMGHSLGEVIATVAAGALPLADGLRLVAERAALASSGEAGAMVAVPLPASQASGYCRGGVEVAAINGDEHCVLSGPREAVLLARRALQADGVLTLPLATHCAFHSSQMLGLAERVGALFAGVQFSQPKIPIISVELARALTLEELTSGKYWADHICKPVHWARAIETLATSGRHVFVEIGAGGLSAFGDQLAIERGRPAEFLPTAASSLIDADAGKTCFMRAVARLWELGQPIDWALANGDAGRIAPDVPTYRFERTVHWLGVDGASLAHGRLASEALEASCKATEESIVAKLPDGQGRAEPHAPISSVERILLEIWRQHFGQAIAVDDDFIELGGSSLLALQIVSALWRRLKVDIPVRSVLQERTIRKLSKMIEADRHGSGVDDDKANSSLQGTGSPQEWVRGILRAASPIGADRLRANEPLPTALFDAAIPDLIRSFRREFDAPFYPGEFYNAGTIEGIAAIADAARHRGVEATARGARRREPKIGRGALVLSSVRSGSTLLRVMLAGHPDLFCPPELHLLAYADMQTRARAETSPDRDQGLVRALSELLEGDEPARLVKRFNEENATTSKVLERLVELSAPRLFVDKSPGNTTSLETLRRAEALFEDAFYIALVRHPYAVIDSVVRNRFVQMFGYGDLDPYTLGEMMWQRSNANILEHLDGAPPERSILVRYEDLMDAPEQTMRQICGRMGIDYCPSVLEPYEGRRMRDGLGDPNLHLHSGITASLGLAWKRSRLPRPLGGAARETAARLGYELALWDQPRASQRSVQGSKVADAAAPDFAFSAFDEPAGLANDTAIIFCHALDGSCDLYRSLADAVASQAATYGLEQLGDFEGRSHAQMCAAYADHIAGRLHQEHILLCGWSFGGAVAFELARELMARGKNVEHVLLLDTPAPLADMDSRSTYAQLAIQYGHALAAAAGVAIYLEDIALATLPDDVVADEIVHRLLDEGLLDGGLLRGEFDRRLWRFVANHRRVRAHVPEPIECPATLFMARTSGAVTHAHPNHWHPDSAYGWRSVFGQRLRTIQVDASHQEIVRRPALDQVAAVVSETLSTLKAALG